MLEFHNTFIATQTDARALPLDEARDMLDVTHNDDDTRILRLIDAATGYLERIGNFAVATRPTQYQVQFRGWPAPFELPMWPLNTVDVLQYYNSEETPLPLVEDTDYSVFKRDHGPGCIEWLPDVELPELGSTPFPVRVTYTAGYAIAPPELKQAIGLLIRHWYDTRTPVVVGTITTEVERSLASILRAFKPGTVPGGIVERC